MYNNLGNVGRGFGSGKMSWTALKTEIDNDYPVILDIYLLVSGADGHILVGYGYRCGIVDNVVTSRIVCAWDPNGFMIYLGIMLIQ